MAEVAQEDPVKRARAEMTLYTKAVVDLITTTTDLGAQRLGDTKGRWPSQENLLAEIDAYLGYVALVREDKVASNLPLAAGEPDAQALRLLVSKWLPSLPIPADIAQRARAFAAHFEFSGLPLKA